MYDDELVLTRAASRLSCSLTCAGILHDDSADGAGAAAGGISEHVSSSGRFLLPDSAGSSGRSVNAAASCASNLLADDAISWDARARSPMDRCETSSSFPSFVDVTLRP